MEALSLPATATPATSAAVDTRPRVDYVLPSGERVKIIFDHGDTYPATVTYQLVGGEIVNATRVAPTDESFAAPAADTQSLVDFLDALLAFKFTPATLIEGYRIDGCVLTIKLWASRHRGVVRLYEARGYGEHIISLERIGEARAFAVIEIVKFAPLAVAS